MESATKKVMIEIALKCPFSAAAFSRSMRDRARGGDIRDDLQQCRHDHTGCKRQVQGVFSVLVRRAAIAFEADRK